MSNAELEAMRSAAAADRRWEDAMQRIERLEENDLRQQRRIDDILRIVDPSRAGIDSDYHRPPLHFGKHHHA